jgi:hypothetical protein
MSLQFPLLSECLITDPAAILALLLKVCESTLQNNRKNMNIPVGRYVSWRPRCSEMFRWYGRGDRGKGGGFGLTRKLWNIFPATQNLSNILEFTQHLISSITDLLRRK